MMEFQATVLDELNGPHRPRHVPVSSSESSEGNSVFLWIARKSNDAHKRTNKLTWHIPPILVKGLDRANYRLLELFLMQ